MKIGSEILVEAGIPFKCNQCDKTFCDNERLGNHKRNVHAEATWECEICARVYKTKGDLRKHKKRNHDPNGDIKACNICSTKVVDISSHTSRQHPKGAAKLCKICLKSFKNDRYLKRHMSIHRIEPNIYACTLCTKEFPSKSSLRDHKMGHKMQVIESKLACNICQKFYPRRNLRNHIRSHETKRVSCNICNKVLATEQNLQMHKAQKHTEREKQVCSYENCKSSFLAGEKYLLLHIKRVHSAQIDTESYPCLTCGKKCKRKAALNYHMLSHTGERPFRCKRCDYKSRDAATLKRHQLVHTREKAYKCKICEKSFGFKHSLEQHITTHSIERPFKCDHCEQTHKTQAYLLRHKHRCHSSKQEQKIYECTICAETFMNVSDFKRHIKVLHKGEKDFKCDLCTYACPRKASLKKHKISIHYKAYDC